MGFVVNLFSILVGLLALPVALVGLVPFFGIANYLALPSNGKRPDAGAPGRSFCRQRGFSGR